MLHRVADRRSGSADIALGQTKEREPRLGIPPQLVRFEERALGTGEVSHAQAHDPDLVVRPSALEPDVGTNLLDRLDRLGLRFLEPAADPADLRPVHTAPAMETPHRLATAPPLHRLRPFLGTLVVGQPLRRAHGAAVHDRCGERIELTRDRGDRGLVDECETLVHVSLQDHCPSFDVPAEGAGGRVTDGSPDLTGAPSPCERRIEVADDHRREAAGGGEGAVRCALGKFLQQLFDAPEPAAKHRELARVEEDMACAQSRLGGALAISSFQPGLVHPLPGVDRHVGVPGEIRGPSEQSAVVRVQGFRGVGLDQQRVPLGPPLPVDRVTGSIEERASCVNAQRHPLVARSRIVGEGIEARRASSTRRAGGQAGARSDRTRSWFG